MSYRFLPEIMKQFIIIYQLTAGIQCCCLTAPGSGVRARVTFHVEFLSVGFLLPPINMPLWIAPENVGEVVVLPHTQWFWDGLRIHGDPDQDNALTLEDEWVNNNDELMNRIGKMFYLLHITPITRVILSNPTYMSVHILSFFVVLGSTSPVLQLWNPGESAFLFYCIYWIWLYCWAWLVLDGAVELWHVNFPQG